MLQERFMNININLVVLILVGFITAFFARFGWEFAGVVLGFLAEVL